MFKDINIKFLVIFVILGAGLLFQMRQESNRVNELSDAYLDSFGRNMWLIGCAQATKQYDACKEFGATVDFGRLIPDVRKITK
jgi:hypothetical protein